LKAEIRVFGEGFHVLAQMGERIFYAAKLAHLPLVYMLNPNPNARGLWLNPHAQHKGLAFKRAGLRRDL